MEINISLAKVIVQLKPNQLKYTIIDLGSSINLLLIITQKLLYELFSNRIRFIVLNP